MPHDGSINLATQRPDYLAKEPTGQVQSQSEPGKTIPLEELGIDIQPVNSVVELTDTEKESLFNQLVQAYVGMQNDKTNSEARELFNQNIAGIERRFGKSFEDITASAQPYLANLD